MKKLLLAATMAGISAACYGQGVVDFGNFNLSVNVDLGTAATHSTALAPAGSFNVALYWASAGTVGMTIGNSTAVVAGTPGLRDAGSDAGVFENGETTVPQTGADTGVSGMFIVAGWEGTQTTYAAALAALDQIGTTPAFSNLVGPGGQDPTVPFLSGWSSDLVLSAAPEPATLAVAGLGAASLLLFRRKK